ncbi:MAG: hypothetical protein DRI73_09265 [Bacteroidetes bacterium]|nr:MAG: hypothetical protein DRI73_09265 [Bacteroidota bacterium]
MDEKGNLWMSTNNGLSRFSPETERFINYDQSDGLQGLQFNFMAYFKRRTGEMFFGGDKGINYFYPESIITNPNVPSVVLTDFKLFNKSVPVNENSLLKKSISEVNELELKYNENFISFEFVALNYTNSHKNQYKYRMIGLEQDTVYAGNRLFADYPDMKPGEYTFWVTGSNNDGVWNKEGVSLQIIIHPPFWRNDLAFFIYALLLSILVIAYVKWRTWRLRMDKENLELQVKERTLEIEKKDLHILETARMKTRFFANVSHEFRTPLTLILSPVKQMMAKKKRKSKKRNRLDLIYRNGLRLLDLANQLLDLSRLDSGRLKLELMEADIIKVLKLIFSSFISLADKKRISYHFWLPEEKILAYFDRGKLETIMNNLLSNAFKYTSDNGEIECKVQLIEAGGLKGSQLIKISVKDDGFGIEEKNLGLIFDRFYQADEQYHTEGGGTGIGLSLTKELVHLLHGEINVVSESGKGSSFTVFFPLGKDHLRDTEYVIVKSELSPALELTQETIDKDDESLDRSGIEPVSDNKSLQLLIVEDNLELRYFVKEIFQDDFVIEEASDGEEGLRKAILSIPDLIITDVMMPVMDGIELCKRVKTSERTSHIPVIILTAKADMESKLKGLETEADDYMIKPFNVPELKTKVNNLIKQRQKLRKRYENNLRVNVKDVAFSSYDEQFINRVVGIIEDHLTDYEFDVNRLQLKVGLSYTQLYRKLFALTGLSPSKFIRSQRCKHAAKLMEQRYDNVTKIAYKVGFNNLSWFAKCFKEFYGLSPSDYAKSTKENL